MKKSLGILLFVSLLVGLLAACGNADSRADYDMDYATEDAVDEPAGNYSYDSDYGYDAGSDYDADYGDYGAYSYSPEVDYGEETGDWNYAPRVNNNAFSESEESIFKSTMASPLSTFSSDVDTASYSTMRRYINSGMQPEGVRIEELVNYFDYGYDKPGYYDEHPFTITTELAACPWNTEHVLAMVGIQGADLDAREIANNVVFLIDVSGSMNAPDRLPLLKESFLLLLGQLDENDRVSIVTYAGSNTILADAVPGNKTGKLTRIINGLSTGGSTGGAAGIETAYRLAEENYIEGGNNRIVLATDGDFNVGPSSQAELIEIIEAERDNGIYISVLGYGMGNLKDDRMEAIADHGNGNYAYIDTLQEAKKVLVDEFDSTMYTIAQDLKLQVEFNPGMVAQYRLIGYDNRRLADEDFNDDTKDAGDIGSGHSVTAFYELVPVGAEEEPAVDGLVYGGAANTSDDFFTVKVRYKDPGASESRLTAQAVGKGDYTRTPSEAFQFASAVVEFGLILTDSDYVGYATLDAIEERAWLNRGDDPHGLRAEFAGLVEEYRVYID